MSGEGEENTKRASLGEWEEHWDAQSQQYFYYNPRTEESSWEKPTSKTRKKSILQQSILKQKPTVSEQHEEEEGIVKQPEEQQHVQEVDDVPIVDPSRISKSRREVDSPTTSGLHEKSAEVGFVESNMSPRLPEVGVVGSSGKEEQKPSQSIPSGLSQMKSSDSGRADRRKSKAPDKLSRKKPTLQIAPLAELLSYYARWVAVFCGIIACIMHDTTASPSTWDKYLFQGVYCLIIWIPFSIMNFLSRFTRVDKSVDSILENPGWPKWVTIPLDILLHYFVKGILYILAAGWPASCPQTLIAAIMLFLSGVVYIMAVIHCDKPKPITGLI